MEELANGFNVNCKVLDWTRKQTSLRALMENARDERYNRIINFCQEGANTDINDRSSF